MDFERILFVTFLYLFSPYHTVARVVKKTVRRLAIYAMRVRNVKINMHGWFASIATRKSARRARFVKSTVRANAIYAMNVFLHLSTNCLSYQLNKCILFSKI